MSINNIATLSGTFFFINLFDIGITSQLHDGTKKYKRIPPTEPNNIFLILLTQISVLKISFYNGVIEMIMIQKNFI